MKDKIHPEFKKTTASCACGASFETGSILKEIRVEICSQCHPFFTGKQKFVDTEGRVEKFQKKLTLAKKIQKEKAESEAAKADA